MRKIITLIIVLITYTSFSQVTPVVDTIIDVDTIITDEIIDTISVTETNETSKFLYQISFSEVNNTFSSKELKTPIFDLFKVEPVYNEIVNQFMFVSDEDINQYQLTSSISQYHITYFKKIFIN